MSILLKEIRGIDRNAALALEEADLSTDSDLQSLTREDLCELIPGNGNFKLRKTIFDKIHRQKPVDVLVNELKGFIPHEPLRAALTTNGVLVNYLNTLKDMKAQMNNVQHFLDVHINLLEDISKSQPPQDLDQGSLSSTSLHYDHSNQTSYHPQKLEVDRRDSKRLTRTPSASTHGHPQKRQVTYKMVVSGKTFDAHLQLLDKVQGLHVDTDLVLLNREESQNNQDYKIIIVFCPVASRTDTDAVAAMKKVTGDEPVILVLMHHMHEARHVSSMRTWDSSHNVVLHVNVFYHETVHGLLQCPQNNNAISELRKELLKYSVQGTKDTSGCPQNVNSPWSFSLTNLFQTKQGK